MNSDKILDTEYSFKFDEIRKDMMKVSYYKYGSLKDNYKIVNGLKAIPSLKDRFDLYQKTGNAKYLADIANFAMIEFMYPSNPNFHYNEEDNSKDKTIGISINEMKDFKNGNKNWWKN